MKVIDSICDRVAVIDKSHIAEIGNVTDVFTDPQSDIAKELILPASPVASSDDGTGYKIRIVFNGESSNKPIISSLILECRIPVNILFADTKEIDGKSYGHMVIKIPKDDEICKTVCEYLEENGVTYSKEV